MKWGGRGPAYVKRDKDKFRGLRVKEVELPLATSEVLGSGIDVMTLPEGHFSCIKCKGYKFECTVMGDFHRLEVGCINCNSPYRFLFPFDCPLPPFNGRFTCKKHPDKAMVIIHNTDVLCAGCESCYTQILFQLVTKSNLILAEDIN